MGVHLCQKRAGDLLRNVFMIMGSYMVDDSEVLTTTSIPFDALMLELMSWNPS